MTVARPERRRAPAAPVNSAAPEAPISASASRRLSTLSDTILAMILGSPLRRRCRQRLAFLHHVYGKHLGTFFSGARVVRRTRRYLIRVAGFERLWRLAVDQQDHLAFHHVTSLGTEMGMSSDVDVGRNLGDAGDGFVVRGRHIDLLQDSALDRRRRRRGRRWLSGDRARRSEAYKRGKRQGLFEQDCLLSKDPALRKRSGARSKWKSCPFAALTARAAL